jgi:hypothetical protein
MNSTDERERAILSPVSGGGHADCGKLIRTYAEDLRALNRSTEKDFLALGSSLYGVSSRAETISRSAAAIVRLVASEELARNMERLKALFESIEGRFSQSRIDLESRSAPLERMSSTVGKAARPLSVFQRIVKRLRMLGISTKIESARLLSSDESFGTLATNVEQLATMIASKSENIVKGLASVHSWVAETLSKIIISRESGERRTREMLDGLSADLSVLLQKRAASSETASNIAARSEEVSGSISEVISSLQFHDITRQQIEHVAEVFDKAAAEETAGGDGLVVLAILREIGNIQIDQLNHAGEQLKSAVTTVTGRLGNAVQSLCGCPMTPPG